MSGFSGILKLFKFGEDKPNWMMDSSLHHGWDRPVANQSLLPLFFDHYNYKNLFWSCLFPGAIGIDISYIHGKENFQVFSTSPPRGRWFRSG